MRLRCVTEVEVFDPEEGEIIKCFSYGKIYDVKSKNSRYISLTNDEDCKHTFDVEPDSQHFYGKWFEEV